MPTSAPITQTIGRFILIPPKGKMTSNNDLLLTTLQLDWGTYGEVRHRFEDKVSISLSDKQNLLAMSVPVLVSNQIGVLSVNRSLILCHHLLNFLSRDEIIYEPINQAISSSYISFHQNELLYQLLYLRKRKNADNADLEDGIRQMVFNFTCYVNDTISEVLRQKMKDATLLALHYYLTEALPTVELNSDFISDKNYTEVYKKAREFSFYLSNEWSNFGFSTREKFGLVMTETRNAFERFKKVMVKKESGENLIKLYSAFSEFGDIRREGKTTISWMALREEPLAPYTDLISNYGVGLFDKRSQEADVNQYFNLDEIEELGKYLADTHGWNLRYHETKTPRDFAIPVPIYPPENGILLFEDPQYTISVAVVGLSSFKMLPGISMSELHNEAGQISTVWSMYFFEELFKKLGVELSDDGVFSIENLLKVYGEVFYESGFYIQKFGQKDLLAEITPKDHIERLEKNKEMLLKIETWKQQQTDSQIDDNFDDDIDVDDSDDDVF